MSAICNDQDSFNNAFDKALKHEKHKMNKDNKTAMIIGSILMLIFIVWALLLAMKTPSEHRVIHLVLAMIFSPAYILAHYLNMVQM